MTVAAHLARGGIPGGMPKRRKKKDFNPGGHKGKLHRELHIPEGEKIPQARLEAAMHSKNREVRDDAIRAHTMEGWHKGKKKH